MKKVKIREVKRGDYLRLKPDENAPLWIRGDYDRSTKSFSVYKYEDVNHEIMAKGDREVYVED